MSGETLTVGQLTREVSVLRPSDSVGRAAEVLRHAVHSAVPVVDGGYVVGLVTEEDLRRLFPMLSHNDSNGDARRAPTVAHLMRTDVVPVPEAAPIGTLTDLLNQRPWDVLPVVDSFGHFRGMISRADVIAAHCEAIRPPVVGGMATPFGVYLTTGALRAGANHLGLFLTGAILGAFMVASQILVMAVCLLIDIRWGTSYLELYQREQLGWDLWGTGMVFALLTTLVFLLLMRFSPLAGTHAAEHQVVHAIERAEPLLPEIVRQMPRPHPRCGTNLVVAMGMLYFALHLPRMLAVIGVLLTVLNWRTLGGWIQYYFTTKPANDRQIQSGIRAGEELLRQYRLHPERRYSMLRRVVNMGLPQVLAGAYAGFWLWEFILEHLKRWSVGL